MKLRNLLAFTAAPFALFAASPALADNHAAPETAKAAAATNGPALWKVADEDTTIYLFGTVHVLPEGIEWYDATIADALTGSDMIVTEIPMDKASEAELQQLTMSKGMLEQGTTLRFFADPRTGLGLPGRTGQARRAAGCVRSVQAMAGGPHPVAAALDATRLFARKRGREGVALQGR